jgi:hypothetical protein
MSEIPGQSGHSLPAFSSRFVPTDDIRIQLGRFGRAGLPRIAERMVRSQDRIKASRSALIWSAWVVGIPCGKPG